MGGVGRAVRVADTTSQAVLHSQWHYRPQHKPRYNHSVYIRTVNDERHQILFLCNVVMVVASYVAPLMNANNQVCMHVWL